MRTAKTRTLESRRPVTTILYASIPEGTQSITMWNYNLEVKTWKWQLGRNTKKLPLLYMFKYDSDIEKRSLQKYCHGADLASMEIADFYLLDLCCNRQLNI